MSDYLTIDALDVTGRTVLVRADLNVPLDHGAVVDDYRVVQSLPTITALRDRGARVVVCSHLGRPQGIDPGLSMAPVATRLGELGDFEVVTATDVAGDGARAAVAHAPADTVVVLENTRFAPGETKNAPALADGLAALADLFVLDAFGSAHRAHASTVGVAERLRSAAGRLMDAEVAAFARLLHDPERPYVVILGGAKVSDKLGVMEALLPKVDALLVGGAMCFTLLAAEGYDVGSSRVEPDLIEDVRRILDGPYGGRVTLPVDIVVADEFASDAAHAVAASRHLPSDRMGLDIGPETVARFGAIIEGADTVFWNGPMGVFEWEAFAGGTRGVAEAVGRSTAYTVAGGGDSVAALRQFGLDDTVSHLSTGGGAGLELLEQGSLPGLDVLRRWA
ncbi:MAG TPA: phosphoglycerate kinase [Acidimicrobiia bacterium]|nr:phosphoglycerate kinase [Acidimicrobiia bacterium]